MNTWVSITSFGAKGDGTTDDLPAFNAAIANAKTIFLPHGRYRVTDTVHLHPDTILIGLNPITTQIAIDDNAPAFATRSTPGAYHGVIESSSGANIITGIGLDAGANNPAAAALKWTASRNSMVNDVKFLGGHGTSRADHRRGASIYNADHSGDGDPARHWDSTGPGLWVTDNGGGTFANIWTASTFSNAGMLVENTSTPSRVYELSSEHHVRNEIIFHNVANWEIYAQQTEEEWGEGEKCLPLDIANCANLTFANTILFRVFGINSPFADGARITDSHNIRFLGVRTYGQSPYNFDNPINDTTLGIAVRSRELGALTISGNPPTTRPATSNTVVAPNRHDAKTARRLHQRRSRGCRFRRQRLLHRHAPEQGISVRTRHRQTHRLARRSHSTLRARRRSCGQSSDPLSPRKSVQRVAEGSHRGTGRTLTH